MLINENKKRYWEWNNELIVKWHKDVHLGINYLYFRLAVLDFMQDHTRKVTMITK